MSGLLRVEIRHDTNEHGEKAYMATPFFRHAETGRVFSVPDQRGWPTMDEALTDAVQLAGCRVQFEFSGTGAVVRPSQPAETTKGE